MTDTEALEHLISLIKDCSNGKLSVEKLLDEAKKIECARVIGGLNMVKGNTKIN